MPPLVIATPMAVAAPSVVTMAVSFSGLDVAAFEADAAFNLDFRDEVSSRFMRTASATMRQEPSWTAGWDGTGTNVEVLSITAGSVVVNTKVTFPSSLYSDTIAANFERRVTQSPADLLDGSTMLASYGDISVSQATTTVLQSPPPAAAPEPNRPPPRSSFLTGNDSSPPPSDSVATSPSDGGGLGVNGSGVMAMATALTLAVLAALAQ